MLIHAVLKSGDTKTGPIPVTYNQKQHTCPKSCPLLEAGCYARYDKVGIWWNKLNKSVEATKAYLGWNDFLDWVKALPRNQYWRFGVAGDLPHVGDGETIDRDKLRGLTAANAYKKLRGWLYTHHDPEVGDNLAAMLEANEGKLTVNASADTLEEADKFFAMGLPTVVLMEKNEKAVARTPNGVKVVECLASNPHSKATNCVSCDFLCQKRDRKFIIGFVPHGTGKKAVEKVLNAA